MSPERAHHFTFGLLELAAKLPGALALAGGAKPPAKSAVEVMGLKFPSPVGLAAGMDKDAKHVDALSALGFGFIEIGTLTPVAQPGNEQPRLFRLPRMGFNNDGMEAVAQRLTAWRRRHEGETDRILVGGNIGKNKDTPNERAAADYLACLKRLSALVDYFVVNVSSPNTPGLRELQDKEPLRRLLLELKEENQRRKPRPLLLKIAPDLEESQLDDILGIAAEARLAGIVATNTTLAREPLQTPEAEWKAIGAGGLSGAPVRERSGRVLRYLAKHRLPGLALVGVGGIDSPESAAQRLNDGADLLQVYSGLVYEGPTLVRRIKDGLRGSTKS